MWFKRKTKVSNPEPVKVLSLEESMELCVGDKVKMTVNGEEITTYVRPRVKPNVISFLSGHFISANYWRPSHKDFRISPNGNVSEIKDIILLESSDIKCSDALTPELASSLKPGWNYIGILDSNGLNKVKVDVGGQRIFWGDDESLSLDKLTGKGSFNGKYFFTLPETELCTPVMNPFDLTGNVLIDVYYKKDKYRVFRCWVKESYIDGKRLVLKHVNDMNVIIFKEVDDLKDFLIYPFDQMRVTA